MVEPDVYVKGYLKDDVIVMCTDGLSNMVPDAKLYEIASQQEPDKASKMLVEEANKNGRTG